MSERLGADIDAWRAAHADDAAETYARARAALDHDRFNCIRHRFALPPVESSRAGDGPLAGVPCVVKANLAVRDEPLDCASAILAGYRSPFDATVVERLRAAGARILGSTNMDEFAMGSSSECSVQGAVIHPRDPERVAGGSSGGSAVAVAAGLVPFALGSDTGGSVRLPAGFCGVVGLAPTWGRLSRFGLVAFASSLDRVGILAREVDDVAQVFDLLAGSDPRDATCATEPVAAARADVDAGVRGLRVGVVALDALAPLVAVQREVRDDLARAAAALRRAGAHCQGVELPELRGALAAYAVLADAEASTNLARYDGSFYGARVEGEDLTATIRRTRSAGLGTEVKQRILLGTWALARGWGERTYRRAMRVRASQRAAHAALLHEVDVLLLPTSPTTAFARGSRAHDPVRMREADVFTVGASLCGLPAVAVPGGDDAQGLPLSWQVVGRAFDEATVLRVARFLEQLR